MTTPRDEAAALLAEALSTDADNDQDSTKEDRDARNEWWDRPSELADRLLAASPTLAADLEFAAAWRRVERALPDGHLFVLQRVWGGTWEAYHMWSSSAPRAPYRGPTPTAALTRLAETLEAMR